MGAERAFVNREKNRAERNLLQHTLPNVKRATFEILKTKQVHLLEKKD